MKKMNNKGFTLVELIIVIAILAIIMLIAIPNFSGIQQRMQVRADKSSAAQIGKAIRIWYTEYTSDDAFKTAVGEDKLPAQGSAETPVKKISGIGKLNEYVDTNLLPKSLRKDAGGTVDLNDQFYYAGIVGTGTAEKVVVCISDSNIPTMPSSTASPAPTFSVGYTGDPIASPGPGDSDNFNATVAYLEP